LVRAGVISTCLRALLPPSSHPYLTSATPGLWDCTQGALLKQEYCGSMQQGEILSRNLE
jgi:hypothetical protein